MFAVVGMAALTAQQAYRPTAHAASDDADGSDSSGAVTMTATSNAERFRDVAGRIGARLAAPAVQSMSRHTLELLAGLDSAIARAPMSEERRAKDLSRQIMHADSAAHANILAGRPIEAIRMAMHAKGLIPSVRQTVAEETAFR